MGTGRGLRVGSLMLICVAVLLGGCNDRGATGPGGVAGGVGPSVTSSAEKLSVAVDGVQIDGAPTVDFSVTNEAGIRYVGLDPASVRFTIAKLVPGASGGASHWQNYINTVEAAPAGTATGPGTEDQVQATTDRGGNLSDHGDGSYTYTFGTDITRVSTPVAVSYDPQRTHRLAIQLSGAGLVAVNAIYTWRPSDGATMNIDTRDIVDTASCNQCHDRLALHGGGRVDTRYCVLCHNPGSTDANSGNTVDFTVMIHRIHRGENLPSVVAGGEYAIWGYRDSKHDYSDVAYPQDIRNCSKCHDAADPATPQGGNWASKPTREACGSCHDDVAFDTGANHGPNNEGGAAQNGECTICHAQGKVAGSVAESHAIPARSASARFAYKLIEVTHTAPGERPVVRFAVTDPIAGDTAYDLQADPAFTQTASRASSLSVILGWDTADYHNTGSASAPAQPMRIDALASAVSNHDGTYTVTATDAVPASATGSGVAALEGHPAADFDGDGSYTDRVPVKAALRYFAITDGAPQARRQVVDIAKCDQCHDQLSVHGNNRTDEPRLCVVCHNPNATDIAQRPADPMTTLDGKREVAIDFKRMIHGIHGAGYREMGMVIYGYGGSANDFRDLGFPGVLSDCSSCHTGDSYMLPLGSGVLASTVDTGADASSPDDDLNITPSAAVCSSCHDSDLSREHMEQNGAAFAVTQLSIDGGAHVETCAVCHAAGRIADVSKVHAVQP